MTITGTGFTGATEVLFAGTNTTAVFTVVSATEILATVPALTATGPITVSSGGQSAISSDSFEVTPTLASMDPNFGPVGSNFSISGTGLTGATSITVNGVSAPILAISNALTSGLANSESLSSMIPLDATSGPYPIEVPVIVNTPAGSSVSLLFKVTAIGTTTITKLSPTSGLPGSAVTLTGTNFAGATQLSFNATPATFTVATNPYSGDTLTAVVPARATTGVITITAPGGSASSPTFTVLTTPAPNITGFTPTSGPPGTVVTITGSGLREADELDFNGTVVSPFSAPSDTEITAYVPAGATSGPIDIGSLGGNATSTTDFVVTGATRLAISSFSPTVGPDGSQVAVSGSGFTGATTVTVAGATASFTVVNDTQLTLTVPTLSLGTTGPVVITTPSGAATSTAVFTVISSSPTTLYVQAGADGGSGSSSSPYGTIAAALKTVQAGDTILVGPGTYRENVAVRVNGVTLKADTGGEVLITELVPLTGWTRVSGTTYQTTITAQPVNLFSGLTQLPLSHSPSTGWYQLPAVTFNDGGTMTITDPVDLAGMPDLSSASIMAYSGGGTDPTPILDYDADAGTITTAASSGFTAIPGNRYIVTNALGLIQPGQWVVSGTSSPWTLAYDAASPSDLNALSAQTLTAGNAISVQASNVVVDGFVVAGAGDVGINITSGSNTISDNVVVDSYRIGVGVYATDLLVTHNVVMANGTGFDVRGASACTLLENEVEFNWGDAFDIRGPTDAITLTRNYIHHQFQVLVHPDGFQAWGLVGGATGSDENMVFDQNVDMFNGQLFYTEGDTAGVQLTNSVIADASSNEVLPNAINGSPYLISGNSFLLPGLGAFQPFSGANYTLQNNVFGAEVGLSTTNGGTLTSDYNLFHTPVPDGAIAFSDDGRFLDYASVGVLTQETGLDAHSQVAPANAAISAHMPFVQTVVNDPTYFQSTTDTLSVVSATGFSVGDIIEINMDGVQRQITAINGLLITFTPALPTVLFQGRAMVDDWGPDPVDLVRDATLAAGSPWFTASSSGGPVGAQVSIASFQSGAFGHASRVLPTITADVQAMTPNPSQWTIYEH